MIGPVALVSHVARQPSAVHLSYNCHQTKLYYRLCLLLPSLASKLCRLVGRVRGLKEFYRRVRAWGCFYNLATVMDVRRMLRLYMRIESRALMVKLG